MIGCAIFVVAIILSEVKEKIPTNFNQDRATTRLNVPACRRAGRKNYLFAGPDRGGERAAALYTLIATAKLNGVDPGSLDSTSNDPRVNPLIENQL
jgi:hypothetical protein